MYQQKVYFDASATLFRFFVHNFANFNIEILIKVCILYFQGKLYLTTTNSVTYVRNNLRCIYIYMFRHFFVI